VRYDALRGLLLYGARTPYLPTKDSGIFSVPEQAGQRLVRRLPTGLPASQPFTIFRTFTPTIGRAMVTCILVIVTGRPTQQIKPFPRHQLLNHNITGTMVYKFTVNSAIQARLLRLSRRVQPSPQCAVSFRTIYELRRPNTSQPRFPLILSSRSYSESTPLLPFQKAQDLLRAHNLLSTRIRTGSLLRSRSRLVQL
jgi:hypothetical protein